MIRKRNLLFYTLHIIFFLSPIASIFAQDSALVYVLDIRTEIGGGVSSYIMKGIQKAESAKADAIIFDVDTPGGKVDSAVKIIRLIQDTKIPTIAFVNRQAISAGAMISAACTQIVMTSGATIGDSEPVDSRGNEVSEKIVSYIRGTIRSTAERQGRNPDIAEAMVDKRLFLVRLKNGDIIKLRPEEYMNEQDAGTQMEILCAEGELLNLTTRQALDYGFVDAQAETISELLAQYQIVEVDERYRDDKDDAVLMALTGEGIINKQEELSVNRVTPIKSLENAQITKFVVTLADRVVFFITSPYISAFLLSLGGLGLFVEIRTPGFGIPGFLGLMFIGLFFGGHMLNQISYAWVPLIFVVGLALIVLEVFVIPGFGIAGILGLIMMLGSIFYVFFQSTDDVNMALLWLSVSVILTSVLAILATIFLPKSAPFQRFALSTVMSTDLGYHSAGIDDFESYLGKTGVALTPLRPAGTARIDNKRLDVVTVGDFIAQNTPVKVAEVEGSKISVEALEE
ncbi:MAG: ATP-dependent Clp protease proteolytic subunit [Candidatus Poribacteria bacterium]|nr:ATP-dependent Clp protease proteolytic subunit [Candidatus Poribacteria bacterium]